MGRASNRKKAQRQTGGPNLRRIKQDARSRAVATRYAFGLDSMVQLAKERVEHRTAAMRAWLGDTELVPAEVPSWPEGSLGHRLLAGTQLMEAQDAPSLLTAQIPHPQLIAADPTHWTIATSALIRSVVFDGLTPDHPAVSTLLEALAPVIEDELAYMKTADDRQYSIGPFDNDDDEDFPELDGPMFLLGRALVEAVWTVTGDDSLSDVLSVLLPALDGVVPGLDAPFIADALIAAFATNYRCEDPADDELLQRVRHLGGNALETLVDAGTVEPGDVLRVGLIVLSTLTRLCQSSSDSVLKHAPELGT
jgi:hypothetical protein